MTAVEDLAVVVALAALTDDRTPTEQKALERVAARVDRDLNRQTSANPHLPRGLGAGSLAAPACTYSSDHGKACVCRGDRAAVEPRGGWSRLTELVEGDPS